MLLRRSSALHELGSELAEEMTDLMEIGLVWFSVLLIFSLKSAKPLNFSKKLGNFLFNKLFNITSPYSTPSILILIFGVLHYFLPTESLNELLFKIVSKDEILNYESACEKFDEVNLQEKTTIFLNFAVLGLRSRKSRHERAGNRQSFDRVAEKLRKYSKNSII